MGTLDKKLMIGKIFLKFEVIILLSPHIGGKRMVEENKDGAR